MFVLIKSRCELSRSMTIGELWAHVPRSNADQPAYHPVVHEHGSSSINPANDSIVPWQDTKFTFENLLGIGGSQHKFAFVVSDQTEANPSQRNVYRVSCFIQSETVHSHEAIGTKAERNRSNAIIKYNRNWCLQQSDVVLPGVDNEIGMNYGSENSVGHDFRITPIRSPLNVGNNL